jgi:hypothetical protein
VDSEPLGDPATDVVANDASVVDSEGVKEADDALGVGRNRDVAPFGTVAPAITEQVEHDEAVTRAHEGNDVGPQVRRGRKAVKKHDRLSTAAASGGVVVQARAAQVDELTSHMGGKMVPAAWELKANWDTPIGAGREIRYRYGLAVRAAAAGRSDVSIALSHNTFTASVDCDSADPAIHDGGSDTNPGRRGAPPSGAGSFSIDLAPRECGTTDPVPLDK